jgi:hypothetical protein
MQSLRYFVGYRKTPVLANSFAVSRDTIYVHFTTAEDGRDLEQKAPFVAAAERDGLDLSVWLRRVALAGCGVLAGADEPVNSWIRPVSVDLGSLNGRSSRVPGADPCRLVHGRLPRRQRFDLPRPLESHGPPKPPDPRHAPARPGRSSTKPL